MFCAVWAIRNWIRRWLSSWCLVMIFIAVDLLIWTWNRKEHGSLSLLIHHLLVKNYYSMNTVIQTMTGISHFIVLWHTRKCTTTDWTKWELVFQSAIHTHIHFICILEYRLKYMTEHMDRVRVFEDIWRHTAQQLGLLWDNSFIKIEFCLQSVNTHSYYIHTVGPRYNKVVGVHNLSTVL